MTDKTPQNKADIPVNTPTTFAGTTDATRNSEPKSRTLPEAGALKARFKAGSIPLQTDFADVIDLANMGRQAVGGAEGQTGPADGFTLSSMGRLELKPNGAKGINVDKDGVAVKVNTSKGLTVNPNDGIETKLGWGIVFSGNGALDASAGQGINVNSDGINVKAGDGITVNGSGVAAKVNKNSGLEINDDGISFRPAAYTGILIQYESTPNSRGYSGNWIKSNESFTFPLPWGGSFLGYLWMRLPD